MKHYLPTFKTALFLVVFSLAATLNASAQTAAKQQKLSKLDQAIQIGFDSLSARKWGEAAASFETARKIFEKEKTPSTLLFTLVDVPDEDNSVPPENEQVRQIMDFRHTMATNQALLQFLCFTHQLNGDAAQAAKFHDAVYGTRGVMWGVSWRVFVPLFYELFNRSVKDEKGDNAGRYQYLAALLLLDAGSQTGEIFDLLQTAQRNSPKDAEIAGLLANGYLQKGNPQEAKKLADYSLSLKPGDKSTLLDLATAEWQLGEFDNSIKHAEAVIKIDASMPGAYLTLAMNYIDKKDYPNALRSAATAVELSRQHPFYLTVQAAAFEASGKAAEAEKTLRKAWQENLPTPQDLNSWYYNKTLRELILQIVKRLEKPGMET